MPRPKQMRTIAHAPSMKGFKPFGIPMRKSGNVVLLFEEYEAVRLLDYMGLTQEQGAIEMNVSRPTFTRIYEKARRTIAQAFVEGKAIVIDGGNYQTRDCCRKCERCKSQINYMDQGCIRCTNNQHNKDII